MQLVIAEKPSVAQSIAGVIGANERKDGYMEGNGYIVSWCVGHLVELAQPDAYFDAWKKWSYESLPMIPEQWKHEVKKDTAAQYRVLKELMHEARVDSVVCATDAGREGELIFRLVYEMAGCNKPMKRLWISSMEESAIREGFAELKPGSDYDHLYESALCRQQADWLVGLNGTRLFTVLYGGKVLKVGRVQTPTLAMLVDRETKIMNFKKEAYYMAHIIGATCVEKAFEIWEQTKEQKSTQLIFCDLSTPKGDGTFNVYEDIKKKLMEKGVPENEIAFIHDANTELRKAELFGKVRSGQVRFLLGSTQKMGAGTNVQDRLIALHHLDVPWRPSDIEQQEGRILRQGNLNPKVKIFRYVTEGTFDSYSWQLIENKQKFIGQIMTSKSPVRSCEDVDEAALTYAEVKALATGNPYIKEKMDLDIQVSKLKLMKANHTSQKYRLEDNITKHYPQQITILKERISGMQTDIQTAKENLPADKEQFTMKVGDKLYTDKKEAGTALVEMCKEIKSVNAPAMIGEYAGFKMSVSFDSFNHKFVMNVKGQLSHNLEIGSDPLGNIARINHALESMPKELAEAKTKLNNVEHQLETAKVEVQKPFAQEEELAEKLDRLSALNALLNMDEKGDDGIGMDDDTPEQGTERTGTFGQDVNQSARQNGLKSERVADKPVQRVSLKERLAEMKIKATGNSMEKSGNRDKRKEEFL